MPGDEVILKTSISTRFNEREDQISHRVVLPFVYAPRLERGAKHFRDLLTKNSDVRDSMFQAFGLL